MKIGRHAGGFHLFLIIIVMVASLATTAKPTSVQGHGRQRQHGIRRRHYYFGTEPVAESLLPSMCPDGCECAPASDDGRLRLECSDKESPAGLVAPPGTSYLFYRNVTTPILRRPNLGHNLLAITYVESGIQEIDSDALKDSPALETLDLGVNRLKELPADVFAPTVHLQHLNLSRNRLHYLEEKVFDNLSVLTHLDLSHNKLSVSLLEIFGHLRSLAVLDLSYNRIASIIDTFANDKLLNISLSNNNIRDIHTHAFAELKHLLALDLSYNKLELLPHDLFRNTIALRRLDLTGNFIKSVPAATFTSLKQLRWLGLGNNTIETIEDRLFSSNTELETLILAYNKIENLGTDKLLGLYSLRVLNVKNNSRLSVLREPPSKHLRSIDFSKNNISRPPDFLMRLKELEEANMKGNPWLCDCQMQWFVEWFDENRDKLDDSQSCDSLDTLDCLPPTSVRNSSLQMIDMKVNTTLDCQIVGNPEPSITWVTPSGLVFHYYPPPAPGGETPSDVKPVFSDHPPVHSADMVAQNVDRFSRVRVIEGGLLNIQHVIRLDAGFYTCFASNPLGNLTSHIIVRFDPDTFYNFKLTSIIIGVSCAAGFLLITFIVHFVIFVCKKCGWTCCCLSDDIPRVKQIYQMVEGLELYKTRQLEKLRDNYTMQTTAAPTTEPQTKAVFLINFIFMPLLAGVKRSTSTKEVEI